MQVGESEWPCLPRSVGSPCRHRDGRDAVPGSLTATDAATGEVFTAAGEAFTVAARFARWRAAAIGVTVALAVLESSAVLTSTSASPASPGFGVRAFVRVEILVAHALCVLPRGAGRDLIAEIVVTFGRSCFDHSNAGGGSRATASATSRATLPDSSASVTEYDLRVGDAAAGVLLVE